MSGSIEEKFVHVLERKPRIVLGSASVFRRAIMDELAVKYRFNYEVKTADIDEKALRSPKAVELVVQLAQAKATAIMPQLQTGLVTSNEPVLLLTCDQVVVHEDRILEKPSSIEEAREFIAGYAKSPACTVGSVMCTNLTTGVSCTEVDVSTVYMEPLPDETVDLLMEEGAVLNCAGGLMSEHPLVSPYIKIEGTCDAVMGLSKDLVLKTIVAASLES